MKNTYVRLAIIIHCKITVGEERKVSAITGLNFALRKNYEITMERSVVSYKKAACTCNGLQTYANIYRLTLMKHTHSGFKGTQSNIFTHSKDHTHLVMLQVPFPLTNI